MKELLENKTVAFQPELYRMYFHKIFPDSREFSTFLTTSSDQKRLESAMRILDRLNFCSNFPIVEDVYANLVRSETEKLSGKDDSHVGQDHFVHTVNLYILGIYLFFNHPVFHGRLIDYFFDKRQRESELETRKQLAVKSFLSAWKYYVCSHDIGYPLESLVDQNGQIQDARFRPFMQQYAHLHEYQAYGMTLKMMAKLIFCLYLFQNARQTLRKINCGSNESLDGQWLDRAESPETRYSLSSVIELSGCGDYVRLEFVQSYEGIKMLMPLIDFSNVVILIRDVDGEPIVLNYFKEGSGKRTWISAERQPFSDVQLRNIRLFGSDEFPANGYSCTYFVKDPMARLKEQLEKIDVGDYCESWSELAESYFTCRHKLFVDLSNDEEENEGVVYKIYRDILRRFPHSKLKAGFLDLWEEEKKSAISPKLRGQILGIITSVIQNLDFQDVPKSSWRSHIEENISMTLEENWEVLCGEGTVEDRISMEIQSLNTMLNILYKKVEEYFKQLPELISMRKEAGDEEPSIIECDLLGLNMSNSKGGRTEAALCGGLLEQVEKKLHVEHFLRQEQNLEDFLCYRRDHSCFDHGIISATLLLSTIVNYCSVSERLVEEDSVFLLAWDIEPKSLTRKLEEKSTLLLVDAIYTILVHNLYPSVYRARVGNELLHGLGKNPFSYFGLLCDSLQLWDRVQQIKPAERLLDYPLEGSHFDLRMRDNQICLVGPLECIEKVRAKCREMGGYLLGADEMVVISCEADVL